MADMSDFDAAALDPVTVTDVMREAGHRVADYLRSTARTAFDRDMKADRQDIVTEHDKNCEEIAVDILRTALPDCRIVGEEQGERAGDGPVTFYIDPIDGTSNFAAGLPFFSFSVGAAVGNHLIGGVVNAPLLGHEFWAAKGHGAWVQSFDQEAPIRLGEPVERTTSDILVLTGFPTPREYKVWGDEGERLARELTLKVMATREMGNTATEIAFVAAGWADATYGVSAAPWDIAGGLAILEEAGGHVLSRELTGGYGTLAWEQVGYGGIAPGRTMPEIEQILDTLDELAKDLPSRTR